MPSLFLIQLLLCRLILIIMQENLSLVFHLKQATQWEKEGPFDWGLNSLQNNLREECTLSSLTAKEHQPRCALDILFAHRILYLVQISVETTYYTVSSLCSQCPTNTGFTGDLGLPQQCPCYGFMQIGCNQPFFW